MTSPLLSLKNIFLKVPERKTPILDDLSLDIFPGEFVVLLGSNGCGKSSLLKVINGLALPSSGTVDLGEQSLLQDSLSKRAKSIITLTQDLTMSTFSDLTLLENCLIALHRNARTAFSIPSKKEKKKVKLYLEEYAPNLCSKLELPISKLSGGERQTLALIMNLWSSPSLLLLDEHTSALDPIIAKKLMELTEKRVQQQKTTTLITTHNIEDALLYGTRIIAMKQGRVLRDIPYEEKKSLTKEEILSFY